MYLLADGDTEVAFLCDGWDSDCSDCFVKLGDLMRLDGRKH